jgi:MFS transporter, ACDE family, multidrug resistance protein
VRLAPSLQLVILATCGFVTSFGAHIVATNLPSYAEIVGVGAFTIGVLIAVYDFAEVFAKPLAGLLADRRGMKATLIGGLVVFIVGSALFLVISPKLLVLVRFVQGLGAAALSTVSLALVARTFKDGRGKAFGIYNAIKGAGYVIAPAAGGFLTQWRGFSSIFAVSAGLGGFALLLNLLLPGGPSTKLEEEEELSLKQLLGVFKERSLLPVYAVIVINMFLVGILFGFLPVYLHRIGYGAVASGSLVSVATLSYLLIQPFAGHLSDKLSPARTVVVGLLVAALATVVVPFTRDVPLVALTVFAGVGVGTVWTNSDALVGSLSSEAQMGARMGAAQSFKELGDMAGPLLVGLLTRFFGVRVGFVTCGAVALVTLVALCRAGVLGPHGSKAP